MTARRTLPNELIAAEALIAPRRAVATVISLTEKQVDVLQRLYSKHFEG